MDYVDRLRGHGFTTDGILKFNDMYAQNIPSIDVFTLILVTQVKRQVFYMLQISSCATTPEEG